MAGPCADAGTSRYLAILTPIGAIDGMFGYGSPAAPGSEVGSADCPRIPTVLAQTMAMTKPASRSLYMRLLVMALALKKQRRLISSNIFVFLHFDISHADSLTDLIRLIEQVRSTPRKKRGIYWTKVSIDTLV